MVSQLIRAGFLRKKFPGIYEIVKEIPEWQKVIEAVAAIENRMTTDDGKGEPTPYEPSKKELASIRMREQSWHKCSVALSKIKTKEFNSQELMPHVPCSRSQARNYCDALFGNDLLHISQIGFKKIDAVDYSNLHQRPELIAHPMADAVKLGRNMLTELKRKGFSFSQYKIKKRTVKRKPKDKVEAVTEFDRKPEIELPKIEVLENKVATDHVNLLEAKINTLESKVDTISEQLRDVMGYIRLSKQT